MKELYAALFLWLDGQPAEKQSAVMAKWRELNDRAKWIEWCAETQGFQKPAPKPVAESPAVLSVPFSLADAHSRFRAWFSSQTPERQDAVRAIWASFDGHPDVLWDSHHAKTAVLGMTMKQCAALYGYDFSP